MPTRNVSVFIYHCKSCGWELVWPVIVPPTNGRLSELRNRAKSRVCAKCHTTGQIEFKYARAKARTPAPLVAR